MNKRYQIFVSSTYSDLHKEREKVIHELTRRGYIAVGMEQFPAADEEQFEYIKRIIDDSDYYVVIIRGKYGSLTNEGISFTEKEYNYAIETKKPVLAFLFQELDDLTGAELDNKDPEKHRKFLDFRSKLAATRLVNYWKNESELVNRIKDSIYDIERRSPEVGWIRGDQAFEPTFYKELEDVRRQNKELQEKLDKLGIEDTVFPSHLSHGSDLFNIEYSFPGDDQRCLEMSWEDLFKELDDFFYKGGLENNLKSYCSMMIKAKTGEGDNYPLISDSCIAQARCQFEALGLIDAGDRRWKLTDKGRRYGHQLKALRRPK